MGTLCPRPHFNQQETGVHYLQTRAFPGVLIKGELTPCGPLVYAPRAPCVGPGSAGAIGVGLFCECDCEEVGTFMSWVDWW